MFFVKTRSICNAYRLINGVVVAVVVVVVDSRCFGRFCSFICLRSSRGMDFFNECPIEKVDNILP